MQNKHCTQCNAVKPVVEFNKNRRAKDGYNAWCKLCTAAYRKRYAKTDRAKALKVLSGHRYFASKKGKASWKRYYDSELGQAANRRTSTRYNKRHPDKVKAHAIVHMLKKAGELVVPEKCSKCGVAKTLHGHHPDYSQPDVVVWLCTQCHTNVHSVSKGV